LKTYDGGTLSGTTITGTPVAEQDWGLDALGNWTSFDQVVGGMVDFNQTRTHNKANEVTGLTTTGNAWNTGIGHDAVGNMTTMPKPNSPASGYTCTYDPWNRLVKVSEGSTTVAEYEYDGLNRRIVKSLGTGTVKDHFYFNEDWQELEVLKETSGTISANPFEQFVWHPYYIDALATRFYDSDVSNSTGVVQHYFTHDANFNVTSAVDTSGNVVERYDYSPYGEPIFLDANFDFDADSVSDIAHSRTYTGQRLDTETGLYQYRNRYYHARLGRFVSRDPIGYEGSEWSLYEYVGGNPINRQDPKGLDYWDCLSDCIEQHTLPSELEACTIPGAWRVKKGIRLPGQVPDKSIWTTKTARSITGQTIQGGRMTGRFFTGAVIFEGFYDIGAQAACALICGDLYPGVDKEWWVK
jgi:RHS repeat-associated protein